MMPHMTTAIGTAGAPVAVRTAAAGIPDVMIVAPVDVVLRHPDYEAAKAGDVDAASILANDIMAGQGAERFVAALQERQPILVSVTALEGGGVNEIPDAMLSVLSKASRLPKAKDIVQVNYAGHTRASGWHRLAVQAIFDGPVSPGAEYWLADDFVGQGGTFANLRGHIESNGGRVIGLTALTGRDYSAKLALSSETLAALRRKHGELETWWKRKFGFGFDALTESEARYLLRAEDADTIRDRLAEAAQASGHRQA